MNGSSSTASATPNSTGYARVESLAGASIQNPAFVIPLIRYSLAATSSIYLVSNQGYTGGAMSAFGRIDARRVR